MVKIINKILFILKYMMLIGAFSINLYIMLSMYNRIDKSYISFIPVLLPYVILLLIFFINIFCKHKKVNSNLFYNLTCCLVLICIIYVGIRTIYDKCMLLNEIMGYGINFLYYSDFIPYMKVMLYGLIISNICFIIGEKIEIMNDNSCEEVL